MFDAAPETWTEKSLGQLCDIAIGGTPSRAEPRYWSSESEGFPWASISDLRSRRVERTKEFISRAGVENSNVKLARRGTVLMSFKLTIGRTAIAGRDLYTNEAIAAFHPKSDVDNEFLFYWLPHLVGTAQTDQAIKGATLNKQKLLALAGMLPPLDEQRRIAEVLRSVDETIAAAQSAADQACYVLDGHLSALMKDGAAHGEHASTGGLPDGWSEDRCDTFFILQRGFDITESQAVPGPFRVISSSGPSYSHSQSAVNGPAVITGRKGRLGTVFYSATPCWPHDTTLWVKDFKGNNPRFVYWKLREMRLDAYDAATSVPTLNRNNVHALTIRFPPLREQGEIVEILDAEEVAIAQQAAVVDALAKAKEVLANDLLSGRVRVPA